MGWFGWAISAYLTEPWIGPEIFFSLINFGQAIGSIALVYYFVLATAVFIIGNISSVVSYVVDAHSNYAPESFATIRHDATHLY